MSLLRADGELPTTPGLYFFERGPEKSLTEEVLDAMTRFAARATLALQLRGASETVQPPLAGPLQLELCSSLKLGARACVVRWRLEGRPQGVELMLRCVPAELGNPTQSRVLSLPLSHISEWASATCVVAALDNASHHVAQACLEAALS